jgi:hypothetical protein
LWVCKRAAKIAGNFPAGEGIADGIEAFLNAWNKEPKPFIWTATVESIMTKLSRCRQTWGGFNQHNVPVQLEIEKAFSR